MEPKQPHKVWSGHLGFGLVSCPVRLFTAARVERLEFHQYHNACHTQLKMQSMLCPCCNTSVEKVDIIKGLDYGGTKVFFTKEEIEAAEPASSKSMEITDFVPADRVDPVYFDSSYYLAADEGGERAFALVREAMVHTDMVAIAKVTMFGSEHVAIVRPIPGGLMLHTLFWAYEVRTMTLPRMPEVSDAELSIATQLIMAKKSAWEPERYSDHYRTTVLAVAAAKAKGQPAAVPVEKKTSTPVVDILTALKMSLANTQAKAA